MGESFIIYLKHKPPEDELNNLILSLGGVQVENSTDKEWRMTQNTIHHIWIFSGSGNEINLEQMREIADWKSVAHYIKVHRKLGGPPESYLEIACSKTADSQKLAMNFALKLGKKWNCVIYGGNSSQFYEN